MPLKLLFAGLLVVITVSIHAIGFSGMIRAILRSHVMAMRGFVTATGLVIVLTCWLILVHIAEISVWGLFYFWRGHLPDAESALYFSAGAYTTVGAGNLVLPEEWRIFAPLEALTGMLMGGLSTGLFFAIVSRWITNWVQRKTAMEASGAGPKNP